MIVLKLLRQLPELVYRIMEILSVGYIDDYNIKESIKKTLLSNKGSSIIYFSNFVDEIIGNNQMNQFLNLLANSDLKQMNDRRSRLSKYNKCIKFFKNEFVKTNKESFLEFAVISLVIIEREDFEKFETQRQKCPNREERILYHDTSVEPISSILTGLFRKSLESWNSIICIL